MKSSRSSTLHPNVLAALHAARSQSGGFQTSRTPQQMTIDPATLQALAQAQAQQQQQPFLQQQPQLQQSGSWAGVDPALHNGYPGPQAVIQPSSMTQVMDSHSVPRSMTGQPLHAQQLQQLLAFQQQQQQAQLAQQRATLPVTPHVYKLVPSPVQVKVVQEKDPFVYVQPEVRRTAELDAAILERIQQRALFVAPPVGRLRTPQACERCRKRKTKCSGDKPTCKRCKKNGYECEYVWEHRANKTKKAVAEREEAARFAEEGAALAQAMRDRDRAELDAMFVCPPAGPSFSSSSGYSDVSAASLPPPLLANRGYSRLSMAMPSYSSSSGYSSGSSLMSALPTPAIMLDGRPLAATSMPSHNSAMPASRSRSRSQLGRIAPPSSPSGSQAVSRSSSAVSLQQPEFREAKASMSCGACLSDMVDCAACVEEGKALGQMQHLATTQRPRSTAFTMASPVPKPAIRNYQPEMSQQLYAALSQTLAQQAVDREISNSPDIPLASLMPHLSRGPSSSSSTSGAQSGAQTPADYFALPRATQPAQGGPYSPSTENMMKISESMAMANLDAFEVSGGMYPSSSGLTAEDVLYGGDGECGLQFGDILHPFDALEESLQNQ